MAKKRGKNKISKNNKKVKKSFSKETVQLIWFFVFVVLVFAAFLIPYYYGLSKKSFEYAGAEWKVEDHNSIRVYHARFDALNNENFIYNLYLRNDPRKNNVPAQGGFLDFRYGTYIALTEEANSCKGELARAMFDLGSFLRGAVRVNNVVAAATTPEFANKSGMPLANCTYPLDRTVIIIEKGEKGRVVQSTENVDCYTITISNCEDILPVEKFMVSVMSAVDESNKKEE